MKFSKWSFLQYIITRAARRQGFLDPIELLARLRSFAQPSEVGEPVELLRAGVVFHARGLINSRVIQYNLDWVWPYWVERQYNPHDESFIPRAFSVSHINLTHRNWTALGYPDCEEFPLVDPRGLLTPCLDGWSLDGWVCSEEGGNLFPSRTMAGTQQQDMSSGLAITTRVQQSGLLLNSTASVELEDGMPVCVLTLTARADSPAWLVLALRPANSEGVSFINDVVLSPDRKTWVVNDKQTVAFSAPAERHLVSDYGHGDVALHLKQAPALDALDESSEGNCNRGMVTAAALFAIPEGSERILTARIPLSHKAPVLAENAWPDLRASACTLQCPDRKYQELYDAAITSLILHSPGDVYPGPSTYRRFWFRDAAYIIHALLSVGLEARAKRALNRFPERQTQLGYFRSQEGEWDSNGEVLWILHRYQQLTGKKLAADWHNVIARGARWIMRKRLSGTLDAPHAGLLPAGFSAEHLGPNDYYYWDDFWGIAGLHCASDMVRSQDAEMAAEFTHAAEDFTAAVDRSLASCAQRLGRPGMPASPYRRLDSGAIGSLVSGYPLQQLVADDLRLLDCAEYLLKDSFIDGAFFQDMIHSGLNAYLTLHVAQVLLRAGDPRYEELMDAVADLATPTGQWPEAIHPRTGGGCMGDGHHVWAAAEWVLMVRNCFVREEGDRLILCAGIGERWLQGSPVVFGPAPTSFGPVSITLSPLSDTSIQIVLQTAWHAQEPAIDVRLPGYEPVTLERNATNVILTKEEIPA
ncbi:MAG: hypothetical protein KUA37_14790 [Desulfomicrobium sp.]|nr:hypothetical protein [Pseudomonadota bacterium]MBV1713251.1 hypothetical protein [Desulfomicrobium sp.]MBU4571355.1 hypothetical protein [Pseudomonadota bacterium]MBU4595617.1 hypothetical protein [Pseudomonadota bacterium]MBV1720059.1 hypothetical protein [Desulfomicrobium sp.]